MAERVQPHRVRWLRGIWRGLFLVVGGLQCLFGVMLGVALVGSGFTNAEGPASALETVLLLTLDCVLIAPGALAVFSGIEPWEPPDDRWQGVRWPILGIAGVAMTLVVWVVATLAYVL